jgi:hypothetical protein
VTSSPENPVANAVAHKHLCAVLVALGLASSQLLGQAPGTAQRKNQNQYETVKVLQDDQSLRDVSLVAAIRAVMAAASARDQQALLTMMMPDVRAAHSSEWPQKHYIELIRILRLGGMFTDTKGSKRGLLEFCAPYAYVRYPPASTLPRSFLDQMRTDEGWVVVGAGVAVRSSPSIRAPVIARLTYDFVGVSPVFTPEVTQSSEPAADRLWHGVYVPSGLYGYVAAEWLWGFQDDGHICLGKETGDWRITALGRDQDHR